MNNCYSYLRIFTLVFFLLGSTSAIASPCKLALSQTLADNNLLIENFETAIKNIQGEIDQLRKNTRPLIEHLRQTQSNYHDSGEFVNYEASMRALHDKYYNLRKKISQVEKHSYQTETELLNGLSSIERSQYLTSRKIEKKLKTVSEARELLDEAFPNNTVTQGNLNTDKINNTLFVLPGNDGEATMSLNMLINVEAPFIHFSQQGWGAKLNAKELDPEILEQVTHVAVFEMPSLASETALRKLGKEVVIIDHHFYKHVDRSKEISSIEQLANYIGYEMNQQEKAMATNDQNYIPGMKAMGLSEEQIRAVRYYDLLAQGKSSFRQIKEDALESKDLLESIKRVNGVYILDGFKYNIPFIYQELGIRSPDGRFNALEIKSHKIGYSGDKDFISSQLMTIDFEGQFGYKNYAHYAAGGGTLMGFKPSKKQGVTQELINEIMKRIKSYDY